VTAKLAAFAGRWTANIAKSQRHPGNMFHSAAIEIEAIGDTLKIVDRFVLESGDTHEGRNVMRIDGLEQPTDGLGNRFTATQLGPRLIDVVGVHAAGDGGHLRYEISEDGRTLTVSEIGGAMRVVFERAEA
jgi:hypothetical protein